MFDQVLVSALTFLCKWIDTFGTQLPRFGRQLPRPLERNVFCGAKANAVLLAVQRIAEKPLNELPPGATCR